LTPDRKTSNHIMVNLEILNGAGILLGALNKRARNPETY